MIVKNESKVIERCLESVKPLIDYWIIVDTGSTDGTQKLIKNYLKGIPGKLYERPWKNFEHNRNEALSLAKNKADYILTIDADEQFIYEKNFKLPSLKKDAYHVVIDHSGSKYTRIQLFKSSLPWKWVGVLHEYLHCQEATNIATLENLTNLYGYDGCRSQDPEKFKKDVKTFEAALIKEPNNERYVFYLAQSYKDAGLLEKAIENYEKRAQMGGFDQEVFWSLYQIANLQKWLKKDTSLFVKSYYKAFHYRPSRIEPLYHLAKHYRSEGNFLLSYLFTEFAMKLPPTKDHLMVESWMTDYGLLLELSISAYYIEQYAQSKQASATLLKKTDLPQNIRDCVMQNLTWVDTKLPLPQTPLLPLGVPE